MKELIFLIEALLDIFFVVREEVSRGDFDAAMRWLQRIKISARGGAYRCTAARGIRQHVARWRSILRRARRARGTQTRRRRTE